jgi:hypothetical protein
MIDRACTSLGELTEEPVVGGPCGMGVVLDIAFGEKGTKKCFRFPELSSHLTKPLPPLHILIYTPSAVVRPGAIEMIEEWLAKSWVMEAILGQDVSCETDERSELLNLPPKKPSLALVLGLDSVVSQTKNSSRR